MGAKAASAQLCNKPLHKFPMLAADIRQPRIRIPGGPRREVRMHRRLPEDATMPTGLTKLLPACETRADPVPLRVHRNVPEHVRDEVWSLGARADQTHFASQNVQYLWNLIEPRTVQKVPR